MCPPVYSSNQIHLFKSNQNVSGIYGRALGCRYGIYGSCCWCHDFVLHFHSFQNDQNVSGIYSLTRCNFHFQNCSRHRSAYRVCSRCRSCGCRCCRGRSCCWCRCRSCRRCRRSWGRSCWCRCSAYFFNFYCIRSTIYCNVIFFHFRLLFLS